MSRSITFVTVPHLGVNDSAGVITHVLVTNGSIVNVGQVVATLETTKTTFDVEAVCNGFIEWLVELGDEVLINQKIAIIGESLEILQSEKTRFQRLIENEVKHEKIEKILPGKWKGGGFGEEA